MEPVARRMHHHAYVSTDLEATRHFYEDVVGLPLVATWCEIVDDDGEPMEFCHTLFGLADGSGLAFFQLADRARSAKWAPPTTPSAFRHIALAVDEPTQQAIAQRFASHGVGNYFIDHGMARSLYANDPDGLMLEFTVDADDIDEINARRLADAHSELRRWLAGDHTSNNDLRATQH